MRLRLAFIPYIITLILLFVPFFWIPYGTMDLGGDASRLYFYDPISYLKNTGLFVVDPFGTGVVNPSYFYIPFVSLIALVSIIFKSTYITVAFFSGIKLALGFLLIYLTVGELLKKETKKLDLIKISGILSGLFYIFMPTMTGNWDKALTSHNQVFINPLGFYLIYKFLDTNKFKYLWFLLVIALIFAPSFALTSAPPFFAFFPLAVLYLFVIVFFRKKKISITKIIFATILFSGLESFHLIPQLFNVLEPGSSYNERIFDKTQIANEGVRYFNSVLSIARVSRILLLPIDYLSNIPVLAIAPFVIVVSLIVKKSPSKEFVLTGFFFLITTFLLGAHITDTGNKFYEALFYIPGFSMFRNFIGQWLFVFSFFYAILFGYSLLYIFEKYDKKKFVIIITILLAILITGKNFISGKLTNKEILTIPSTHIAFSMNNNYLDVLSEIKKLPDGKILTLPLTDAFYQIVPGEMGGVYIGPSITSYIGGKNDFVGYQTLDPFGEQFLKYSREKRFDEIHELLSILNIKYIVFQKSALYENITPDYYSYTRQSMPDSINGYEDFIKKINAKSIYSNNSFVLYELQDGLDHFYIPQSIKVYSSSDFREVVPLDDSSYSTVYINEKDCVKVGQDVCSNKRDYSEKNFEIKYTKMNPILYRIRVTNTSGNYIIVFSEAFDNGWNLYANDKKDSRLSNIKAFFGFVDGGKIKSAEHIKANGYANGWIISNTKSNNFYIVQEKQKIFFYSSLLTIISIIIVIVIGAFLFRKKVDEIINWFKLKF